MVTGSDLLAVVKANSALYRSELMEACGYDAASVAQFTNALLEAKGVFVGVDSVRIGRAKGLTRQKRRGSGVVKVHFNGAIVLGKPYSREMSLQPGDKLDVIVGRNSIKLVPHGRGADENTAAPALAPQLQVETLQVVPVYELVAA